MMTCFKYKYASNREPEFLLTKSWVASGLDWGIAPPEVSGEADTGGWSTQRLARLVPVPAVPGPCLEDRLGRVEP